MTTVKPTPPSSPDTTDLERRVLAHERILQTLIAYMARTEPRFVDHLRERFVEPMAMARREHDYRGADDYAEEFIRAVMLLGEMRALGTSETQNGERPAGVPERERTVERTSGPAIIPERVQMRERGGIWEIKVDGVFWGDYHQKQHALAAAAAARLLLR